LLFQTIIYVSFQALVMGLKFVDNVKLDRSHPVSYQTEFVVYGAE
jgi:hypothetical protein